VIPAPAIRVRPVMWWIRSPALRRAPAPPGLQARCRTGPGPWDGDGSPAFDHDKDAVLLLATSDAWRELDRGRQQRARRGGRCRRWQQAVLRVRSRRGALLARRRGRGTTGSAWLRAQVDLASVALVTCSTIGQERGAEPDILIGFLGNALARRPGFRGPRTATQTAILTGGHQPR